MYTGEERHGILCKKTRLPSHARTDSPLPQAVKLLRPGKIRQASKMVGISYPSAHGVVYCDRSII